MSTILRAPALTVTTRHSASVYPWTLGAVLPAGVPIGVNVLCGGTAFGYDPWSCYAAGILSSPNMVVAGQLGRGKSALVKTYLARQLATGRRAYVLDPKGEYTPLAHAAGMTVISLRPGGPHRLNPLDPPLRAKTAAEVAAARTAVLTTLATTGAGVAPTAEERAALAAVTAELDENAILRDVVNALLDPSPAVAASLSTTPARLAGACRPLALALHRLLTGDLAGMVDTATTVRLSPHLPGVVVDLSAVHGSDALAPVMVCAGAWLTSAVSARARSRKLLLVDEAWAVLAHSATTRWLQQVSKLARAYGVQLITVVHRLSDLAAQTDTGTAAHAQALGLLADAETRVIYAQAPGERTRARELLDLSAAETSLVTALPPHRALWRVGGHTALVDHVLTDAERVFTDTDQAMRP